MTEQTPPPVPPQSQAVVEQPEQPKVFVEATAKEEKKPSFKSVKMKPLQERTLDIAQMWGMIPAMFGLFACATPMFIMAVIFFLFNQRAQIDKWISASNKAKAKELKTFLEKAKEKFVGRQKILSSLNEKWENIEDGLAKNKEEIEKTTKSIKDNEKKLKELKTKNESETNSTEKQKIMKELSEKTKEQTKLMEKGNELQEKDKKLTKCQDNLKTEIKKEVEGMLKDARDVNSLLSDIPDIFAYLGNDDEKVIDEYKKIKKQFEDARQDLGNFISQCNAQAGSIKTEEIKKNLKELEEFEKSAIGLIEKKRAKEKALRKEKREELKKNVAKIFHKAQGGRSQ